MQEVVEGWNQGFPGLAVPLDGITITSATVEDVDTLVYTLIQRKEFSVRVEATPVGDSGEWWCRAWKAVNKDKNFVSLALMSAAASEPPFTEFPLYPQDVERAFHDEHDEAWGNVTMMIRFLAYGIVNEIARTSVERADGFANRYREK